MKKVYNCLKCGKWFKEAKIVEFEQIGEVELCPFCEGRAYPARGIKAALVRLWWDVRDALRLLWKVLWSKDRGWEGS